MTAKLGINSTLTTKKTYDSDHKLNFWAKKLKTFTKPEAKMSENVGIYLL